MKICVFGESSSFHTETVVNLFKDKHSVTWFIANINDAAKVIPDNFKVTYEPSDLEGQSVYIICTETGFNNLTRKVSVNNLTDDIDLVKLYGSPGCTVIVESLVGIGMTRKLFKDVDMHVVCSPSNFDSTSMSPLPVDIPKLIGGGDEESEILVMQLFVIIYISVIMCGTAEIAEGAALLEMSNKVVQKAFLNEFADYCTRIKLDVHHVIDVARNTRFIASPWVGNSTNDNSAQQLIYNDDDWPVLSSAALQLERRPALIYERIVERYCGKKNYDELHKKAFLVVGVGEHVGSTSTRYSPVLEIINLLELEGAKVKRFDLYIDGYSEIPTLLHNSGLPKFDGILVMHPYLVSKWEKLPYTTFFCRH
jgi:UDP-N-acetyl-D-mannosaminuronate dehydrogenase